MGAEIRRHGWALMGMGGPLGVLDGMLGWRVLDMDGGWAGEDVGLGNDDGGCGACCRCMSMSMSMSMCMWLLSFVDSASHG